MNQYFIPKLPARNIFPKWNISDFVVSLSQVLDINGHLLRRVINVDVYDVEYLIVVVGPDLNDTMLLKARFLVHQYCFELHIAHSSVINIRHLTR